MSENYWKDKWAAGDIGFHQSEAEPELLKHFSPLQPGAVLVPFCGKSKDLKWLLDQGWKVLGAELSPIACEAFFEENKIPFERISEGPFTIYRGKNIAIWCGDFFALPEIAAEGITAYYDRAALIALPAPLRQTYAAKVRSLLKGKQISGLLLTLEYRQEAVQGPPFSVEAAEVRELYGPPFQVRELSREADDVLPARNPKFAGVSVREVVYRISGSSRVS